jgi:hypothetical protein
MRRRGSTGVLARAADFRKKDTSTGCDLGAHLLEVNWIKNSWESLSRKLRERLESLGLQSPDAIDALCGEMDEEAQQEILSKVMNVDKSGLEADIIHEFLSLVRSATTIAGDLRESWARIPSAQRKMGSRPQSSWEDPCSKVLSGTQLPARPRKAQWKTKAFRKKSQISAEGEREEFEEKLRERWVNELIEVIRLADLPLIQAAQRSVNPSSALQRCGQGRKYLTIRDKVRKVRKLQEWLRAGGASRLWPSSAMNLQDYLQELADEPCARTVPAGIMKAVRFMELAGSVMQSEGYGDNQQLWGVVHDLEVQLAKKGGGRDRKQASMFLVSMVVSLELCVCTQREVPEYIIAFAWVKLLKIWGVLRYDDTLGLLPESMELDHRGLSAVIVRSKTTGAGKPAERLHVNISRDAFIAAPSWLEEGHILFQSDGFDFPRDYLLPLPNKAMSGCKRRMALYADAAKITRGLWQHLRKPIWKDEQWSESEDPLFTVHPNTHYSEHSERNWLDTQAAGMKIPKDERDMLGWKREGSDVYVRACKRIVEGIQSKVARALRTSHPKDYADEHDALKKLKAYWLKRGEDELDVSRQIEDLAICVPLQAGDEPSAAPSSSNKEVLSLEDSGSQPKRIRRNRWDEPPAVLQLTPVIEAPSVTPPEESPHVTMAQDEEEETIPEPGLYISITGGRKFRRLHRWRMEGGCKRKPGVDYRSYAKVENNNLEKAVYDDWCKTCWLHGRTPEETAIGDIVTGDSPSSSDSDSPSSSDGSTDEENRGGGIGDDSSERSGIRTPT